LWGVPWYFHELLLDLDTSSLRYVSDKDS
jgi:hypothetical protein